MKKKDDAGKNTPPAAEKSATGTESNLQSKLFRLSPVAIREFDILKAEQGSRSGPRLIAEAIDLLLVKYGKKPLGAPK